VTSVKFRLMFKVSERSKTLTAFNKAAIVFMFLIQISHDAGRQTLVCEKHKRTDMMMMMMTTMMTTTTMMIIIIFCVIIIILKTHQIPYQWPDFLIVEKRTCQYII